MNDKFICMEILVTAVPNDIPCAMQCCILITAAPCHPCGQKQQGADNTNHTILFHVAKIYIFNVVCNFFSYYFIVTFVEYVFPLMTA